MNDFCIRFIKLPNHINGMTVQDETGFYNIYINDILMFKDQQKTIEHELTHIKRNDFNENKSLFEAEKDL